ncbi:MAG: hypothetical protein ACLFWF_07750 [Alphaproteobacteria bacterium]
MDTVIRVSAKLVGAVLVFAVVLVICIAGAWTIEVLVDPTDKILFVVGLSVLSWLFLMGLMVYRLIVQLRSAMLTLILAMPTLVTMMYGLIFFFPIVRLAIQEYAPWAAGGLDAVKELLKWFGEMYN